jgi:hypothetical protein
MIGRLMLRNHTKNVLETGSRVPKTFKDENLFLWHSGGFHL